MAPSFLFRTSLRALLVLVLSISAGTSPAFMIDGRLTDAIIEVSTAMRPAGCRLAGFPFSPPGSMRTPPRQEILLNLKRAIDRRLLAPATSEAVAHAAVFS